MARVRKGGSLAPALLAFVALEVAGLLVLAGSGIRVRRPGEVERGSTPAAAVELAPAPRAEARRPLCASPVPERRDEEGRAWSSARPARVRKEREYLLVFRELARSEPGALEARAQVLLEASGPAPERVALLRVLVECGSPESTRWHELAVRASPDDSGPHAVSVASYALGALARRAAREADAREALLRLSFERTAAVPELRPELRRGAATALASSGEARELELLRRALLRETDELLVMGVLSALEPRADVPEVQRILASFAREARVASAAEE